MSGARPVRALLFDVGGVVIDIDFERALTHWARYSGLGIDEMRSRMRVDDAFRRHETGQLQASDYFDHLRTLFHLDADDDAIAAGWNAILVDANPEAVELVKAARRHRPCFAFSNTSATHHASWSARFPQVNRAFDRLFLSFELGERKPDPGAFAAVVAEIGQDAASILFFDDTAGNVEGARAAGLQAVQVNGPDDIRQALLRHRLL